MAWAREVKGVALGTLRAECWEVRGAGTWQQGGSGSRKSCFPAGTGESLGCCGDGE